MVSILAPQTHIYEHIFILITNTTMKKHKYKFPTFVFFKPKPTLEKKGRKEKKRREMRD